MTHSEASDPSTDRLFEIAGELLAVDTHNHPGERAADRLSWRSATGGGDAKTFRHAGVPTVEFAFGTDTVHAVDEYTTAAALRRTAAVYERLPAAFAERES